MQNFEIIIAVFGILILLLAVADKVNVPYPALLVLAGLVLGFIPSLPSLELNPDIVFLIFLPPILYDAASNTSWHDFKSDIRPISTLAVTLVFLTTMVVACVSYFFIPWINWPLAFVIGAIVSPPDAVAATSITKGLGLNRRVITILQGESLVNDASALIAYRFAIVAITTGSFVFLEAGVDFLIHVFGGVLTGVVIGYIIISFHRKILNNSIISTSLTLLTPFISYLLAERVNTSGVLAVVSTGLMVSWRAPEIFSFHTRIRNRAVWDTFIFLLNGFIFILIGWQLPSILNDLNQYRIGNLIGYGLLVSGATIVVRVLWVFGVAYSPIVKNSEGNSNSKLNNNDTWKNVMIVAWTGTRGVVSLATALALPLTLANGSVFHQRSLILFLAFVVIFVTLVVQGLTLPLLIRMLGVKQQPNEAEDDREMRLLMATSVINFIDHEFSEKMSDQLKLQVKRRHTEITHILSREMKSKKDRKLDDSILTAASPLAFAQKEVNEFQRQLLLNFHKDGTFSQATIRRMEQELDSEDLRLSLLVNKKIK